MAREDARSYMIAGLKLSHPNATWEEYLRGADWMLRLGADSEATERHENLPMEDKLKAIEKAMFGEGDHSDKRTTPPPGAIRPGM